MAIDEVLSDAFLKLISDRYSVRKFTNKEIEKDVLDKILQAGHLAPTACNKQPQKILVINSEDGLLKLKKCTECHFDAPAALLVCYNSDECWKRVYDGKSSGEIDASIVTTHMMLEAYALGVGTTWVMHFIPEAVRVEFDVPSNIVPVALLVMGYPAPDCSQYPGHSSFRAIEEVVSYNSF